MNSGYLDDMFYRRAIWYLKFAWLPKTCDFSRKRIWFRRAYRGLVMYAGPGEPVIEYRWIAKEQFLFARLQGKI
jgi:hypothetical protein